MHVTRNCCCCWLSHSAYLLFECPLRYKLIHAIYIHIQNKAVHLAQAQRIPIFSFSSMIDLMYMPHDDSSSISLLIQINIEVSMDELYELQMRAKSKIKEMLSDTASIPRELLFVGRNMNLIRSNNKYLGSPVDRVCILHSPCYSSLYLLASLHLPHSDRDRS